MNNSYKNLCIRCGSERVVLKIWKEQMGTSTVVTKEMICPNNDCQKKVNADNKKQQDRYANLKLKSAQRLLSRRAAMDAERVAKHLTKPSYKA